MKLNHIYHGNCLEVLKTLPDNSVDCCVTSSPYWGLRDYGTQKLSWPEVKYSVWGFEILVPEMECSLGLESDPKYFIGHLVLIFREIKRVLKKEATLWMNLGDTYAGYWGDKYGQGQSLSGSRENNGSAPPSKDSINFKRSAARSTLQGGKASQLNSLRAHEYVSASGLKPKDLVGIPWMASFALRDDGWYLRQDNIWHKPNPMPESVTDRCTKSHEYLFLLSKSPKYYYDAEAIKTPVRDSTVLRMMQQVEEQHGSERVPGKTNGTMKAVGPGRNIRPGVDTRGGNQGSTTGIKAYSHRGSGDKKLIGHSGNFDHEGNLIGDGLANKKSVWTVTTKPFKEAHFATFPEDLIIDCIKAGSKWGGVILDPFMGSGTTALVAQKLGRNYIGIELNQKYIGIATRRLRRELGMFNNAIH